MTRKRPMLGYRDVFLIDGKPFNPLARKAPASKRPKVKRKPRR